jgi:hypothetical protein
LTDPVLLDRVVGELRELERRGGIERTLAIGELILMCFFGGNAATWRDRRRNKNNSIRRLASRAECPFSKSALNEAVAVYVASLTLPCVRTFGHIGASHVTAVLGLPERERERMLERADRERMSVRELRRAVVGTRRAEGERRGRPGRDAWARALGRVREAAGDMKEGVRRLRVHRAFDAEAWQALHAQIGELSRLLAEARELAVSAPTVARTGVTRLSSERSA